MHTRESIAELLARNPNAVYRALIVLYNRQTADEKQAANTKHSNQRGFNARDAKFGSSLAEQCIKPNPKYATPLSSKQLENARKMLNKYCGQLARVANKKD